MTKQKQNNKTALKIYYESMGDLEKAFFMNSVSRLLGCSTKTVYRRMVNPDMFNQIEKEAIAHLVKKDTTDLFPGKR